MSADKASSTAAGSVKLDPVRALQHALYRSAKADPGRRFHALRDKVDRRDVLWRAWGRFAGPQPTGRTLGLVGLGAIGSRVARLEQAFGMTVSATDPAVPAARFAELDVTRRTLPELVAEADVLSLHLPFLPGGGPLVDGDLLRSTKPGVVVVNAARGGLLDERVLAELLVSGHVAGAALDALSQEPADLGRAILSAPNTILTPHIGAYSDKANAAMGTSVVHDIARVLRGDAALHPVTGGPLP